MPPCFLCRQLILCKGMRVLYHFTNLSEFQIRFRIIGQKSKNIQTNTEA